MVKNIKNKKLNPNTVNKIEMKKLLFFLILFSSVTFSQFKFGAAKGLFMWIAVGPRFPIGVFADAQNIGIGAEVIFSYSDNEILPIFLYTMIGYQHSG